MYIHLGQPAAQSNVPAFRLMPAGCPPQAASIVRRGIRDAIWLAENAASKLSARDAEAVRLFRFFFGDPERPVPWADKRPAADLVAHRFQAAAKGFRTRVPHMRCAAVGSGAEDCSGEAAFVVPRSGPTANIPLPRNTITLCAPFWSTTNAFHRAAMLLHEMLHLLFWEFFGHQENLPRQGDPEERRRDNSYCYHVFALRVAKHGAPQAWRSRCTDREL
jgi:hypothetical protein